MGNILAPPPAAQGPPALVLEEDSDGRALLLSHLNRCKSGSPQLGRILGRTGSAEAVCRALKGGANGAGGTARDGFSALHVACACGWDDLIEELLKAGVLDVDVLSRELYTPLMLAAMCGHAPAVRLLLGRGAQLGRRSRRGATAIALAAQSAGSLSALHALLEHPSCTPRLVRQLGFRQRSPLVLSVMSHGSPAVVRALLGAGADPSEACTARGSVSVLHTCAHLARVEAMRELIAAGARVNAEAQGGTTVLQEVFVQPPSRQRPEAAKRDMFRMLVAAGADVNYRSPHQSYTVLHFALASCREEATANMVLDSGADLSIALNQPLRLGEANEWLTMLHVACVHGWSRLAERLVQAGADLTSRNKDGMQPIHTAVLGCHEGIVQVLLRCGADPLATCPDCYPSLAVWKMRRYVRALQAMIQPEHGAEAFPALADLLNLGTAAEGGPHLTAVDLAACVARHIPTLEAFVERGVRPSPEALALAEHSVPLMRAVVERPLLTPELAARLPPRFRAAARETLLCLSRPVVTPDGRQVVLPPDAVAAVLQQAAFPVSPWASPAWLAAQKVREPAPRVGARVGQQAQQGGAAPGPAGAAALPPGVHVLGPGEQPPPFVQAMVNQMQQHFGEVGAQPHFIVVHQQQGEAPPGGAADAAGGAANAAGGAGGAAGVADAAAQAQGAPGQQVHVMQFQIPLGPGGLPAGPAAAAAGAQGGLALPAGAAGFPGFMQDFVEGMLAGMAHAAGAGDPPGGFPGGPLPFPFGGGPLVFEEEDWDSDDDDELDDEEMGFEELDDLPDLHWQPGVPQEHGPAPAAPLPGPPPPEAAAAAPPEGPDSADGGGETSSRAAPVAPGDALGSDDVAGPSTSGASGPGKRPASGSATPGRSSQGYDLRDRSKRQRGQ
ncbi:hypothetical protein ABPG77_000028 [Micractinium sp. CCAP 211/92]